MDASGGTSTAGSSDRDSPHANSTLAKPMFPGLGGASIVPGRPSVQKRLGYLGLQTLNRVVPKRSRAVVLHSTVDVEDGVLAVIEGLQARGWTATVLLEDRGRAGRLRSLAGGRVRALPKRSARGLLSFLTARYVMTTENIYGNTKPPGGQLVVNIWHGEPPTKVTARFFAGQGALHASYAPVCSTVGRAYRAAAFDLHPLRVPIIGAPRNDRMLRSDGRRVRRALLGADADAPVFFWLPSFRAGHWGARTRVDVADYHPGLPFSSQDVRRLDEWLAERGARVVVKLHPHDVASFSGEFRAIRVLAPGEMERSGLTLYQVLPAFDGLITDVSSVWVDYLLLDKPLIFAFPDIENYRSGRGLNLEPYEHWVPGPFTATMDELLAALGDLIDGRDPMAEERGRARLRFHYYRDHRSTERLLDGLGIHPA